MWETDCDCTSFEEIIEENYERRGVAEKGQQLQINFRFDVKLHSLATILHILTLCLTFLSLKTNLQNLGNSEDKWARKNSKVMEE